MSDVQPQPEPPHETPPSTTESGESSGFYVVVGGSGVEDLPPATDSEGELDPTSGRLALQDLEASGEKVPGDLALMSAAQPLDDTAAHKLDDSLRGSELKLADELLATSEIEEPDLSDVPDALFSSDVTRIPDLGVDRALFASEGAHSALSDDSSESDSGIDLLDQDPANEAESPFKPLELADTRPPPPKKQELAPLRHGRRRDEYFAGATDYVGPPKDDSEDQDREPDPNAVGAPLQPVDEAALPAYVVENMEARARQREQQIHDYAQAHRGRVGRLAVTLAISFAIAGQVHGMFSLLGTAGMLLLPWDALLGALSGIVLARSPNALMGQVYVGGAAMLAMGTKFAWVVPTGTLQGLDLLISFVCSLGCMAGAVIGGGVLGLSLEQRLIE